MRNRIVNNTTKPKSLARIEREERESKPQRSTVTGRASASTGATIRHFSAKPANQTSSAQSSHTLKPLPQIEREERESMHRSSYSSATGHASGGVGNIFSRVNHDSTNRTTDTTQGGGHSERAERYNIKPVSSPPTPSRNQSAEAALLAKLPSDFPADRWDNMSTREQNSIMRRSGLTVQEQWKLLNATTPMKALSVLNAVQTGLNNGTLTSREAAALTGGSLRYAETKKQLASGDASILPPLQKRLLHGELEDTIDSIRAKAEGINTDTPQATPNPLASLLPQPGSTPPPVNEFLRIREEAKKNAYFDHLESSSTYETTWDDTIINNQNAYSKDCGTFGTFGNLGKKGCGAFAIHNANQILGVNTRFDELSYVLKKNGDSITNAFGILGMNPLVIGDYYKQHGAEVTYYINPSKVPKDHDAYIAMFFHLGGAHYVAAKYDDSSEEFEVYNMDTAEKLRNMPSLTAKDDVYTSGSYGWTVWGIDLPSEQK